MELKDISIKLNLPLNELQYRADGRIEWVCSHGIGHTVYAPKSMGKYGFIHGCDGCCNKINTITDDM